MRGPTLLNLEQIIAEQVIPPDRSLLWGASEAQTPGPTGDGQGQSLGEQAIG